jgi:hypothetical protein
VNFEGYKPQTIPRLGSLVQSDDPTALPYGVASDVQNCSFRAQTVGPRDGTKMKLTFGAKGNSIGGLGMLRYLAPDNSGEEDIQLIVATNGDGNVWGASPFTQSTVQVLTTDQMLANAGLSRSNNIGLYAQCAQAYNKMFVAQGNLLTGVAPALIVDGATLNCDPVSDKPFGDAWIPQTMYRVGQVVSPTINTSSNLYICTQTGMTAATEPVWPTTLGASVTDGTGAGNVVWKLLNIICTSGLQEPAAPTLASVAGGVAVPAGYTLFLACTWLNQFGESDALIVNPDGTQGNILQYLNNTGADVNVEVILPAIPSTISVLAAQYQPTGCNIYGYLVAGTPDPTIYLDPTSYAFIGSGVPSGTYTVAEIPTGQQIPQVNNAFTTPAGNVSSGVRYMIVLYMNRSGYICGFSGPSPIRCNVTVDGRAMLVQNLPIGPYNCVARICAFTVAGQGSAGPYFYIATDDYVDPGLGSAKIRQTATKIPDNITQAAYFDFLDSYLTGASEVTDYFDRIEVPPCSDIYFSKSLNRVVYTGAKEYDSSLLISDLEDGEAIRDPGSVTDVSPFDGDRVVCMRDLGTTHIAYKENSAHTVTPNDGDPSDWDVEELWTGCGTCNPRAIDVAQSLSEKFHAFAHETGGYVYQGNGAPTWVTKELKGTPEEPGVWDRINWAASNVIRTTINLNKREIYFFVPLDGATTNTARITVNYLNGFDEPIVFVVRSGREVPNINGRKWSVDSVAANDCIYVPQRTAASA